MLSHIHIRDFAIIEELALEFAAGMTALTGETGAGKSILVDALGLVLGDRADSNVIRHGAERTEISAAFTTPPQAAEWLRAQEMDADDDCLLRRVVTREGRSRAFINGSPVPVQSLKELGDLLVDIHGQHEHQSLLRREVQRELLDAHAGNERLLEQTAERFRQWKTLREEFDALREAEANRTERLDMLRFQVQELAAVKPRAGEAEDLRQEHGRLAHAGHLLETCQQVLQSLYERDEGSAHAALGNARTALRELTRYDTQMEDIAGLLDSALIQLDEAVDALRSYCDRVDLDPARLNELDQRLGALHQLARKHRVGEAELPALFERLQGELDGLDHAEERLAKLEAQIEKCEAEYRDSAGQLSAARAKAAKALSKKITEGMQELGMPGGKFDIAVDMQNDAPPAAHGLDRIEFRVSANPGQPVQALAKVASGGELSRISLAIQVVAAGKSRIDTLIFDEVDAGIGGGVAEIVGQRLRALGDARQVLCVTHLPQVAAQAHHHLQVSKLAEKTSIRTRIRVLQAKERIDEIARMLGGVDITAPTRAHAEEMLKLATARTKRGQTRFST